MIYIYIKKLLHKRIEVFIKNDLDTIISYIAEHNFCGLVSTLDLCHMYNSPINADVSIASKVLVFETMTWISQLMGGYLEKFYGIISSFQRLIIN